MTQQEFTEMTGLTPTAEEFYYVHAVYLQTSMNKDEFCKDFKKHGCSKIIQDVHARAVNFKILYSQQKELDKSTAEILISKACVYEDPDLYKAAVRLIGQREVVMSKIQLGLPLWDIDRDYIENNLK